MKRDRIAVWLDVRKKDESDPIYFLKYKVPPRERGELVRKSLEQYLRNPQPQPQPEQPKVDDDVIIIGQAVYDQLKLHFPDEEITDDLIVAVLVRGINSLKAEREQEFMKALAEL